MRLDTSFRVVMRSTGQMLRFVKQRSVLATFLRLRRHPCTAIARTAKFISMQKKNPIAVRSSSLVRFTPSRDSYRPTASLPCYYGINVRQYTSISARVLFQTQQPLIGIMWFDIYADLSDKYFRH